MKVDVVALPKDDWDEYIRICGWALARAHARTGDPARIAGYLGKKPTFDEAIAKFAAAYADQNERDYQRFLKAIRAGKLPADANAAP
jgi:NAD(P)H-dependent flavin oxidoreductase YrpB (nitropropane dioxygenase family)